ncbi:lon peptidase 2, peroxisomal [Lamellibrachia satsuma]|nr:lon peptidase 2, peroxisomal [Lamellibrachia satsuma]
MVKSRLLRHSTLGSTIIGVVLKEPGIETDEFTLHTIGTAAVAVQVTGTNWPEPAYTLLVTGLCRFKIEEILQETPYPVARVAQLENVPGDENDDLKNLELGNLVETFREHAMELVNMLDVSVPVVAKLKKMLDNVPSQQLPDICVSIVKASLAEKVQVLDAVDLAERFKKTLPLLMRQIEGLKLLQKSHAHKLTITTRKPSRGKTINIRKALEKLDGGMNRDQEETEEEDEIAELENKIKAVGLTPVADKAASRELKRLKNMPQQMPEHAMIRNYLELMVELPWNKTTTDSLDIAQARKDLDTDHYGLDKLKKRVIEYLAVRQLKSSLKGPILCFVGPPGVGKTSIGRSIAQTLGREFYRIALGGVCDQSDVRGHRRTYIGSMPGRIIQGLKLVGVKNPVFLLDEIDKLGTSLHGDPAAALLEVLDPEQNHAFVDHYLNVPFDLSQVLFIATANTTATVPAALLDRMELIQIPGYTYDEKTHIAMRHLIPKQLGQHGLNSDMIHIPEDSVKVIVSDYTREAGVRTLERRIAAVCRAVAVRVTEYNARKRSPPGGEMGSEKKTAALGDNKDAVEVVDVVDASAMSLPPEMPIVIDEHAIEDILGPAMYESETSERLSQPGVAVGLAWTVLGGEIMFVEATKMEGEGKLTLTGQLGDVMKESASLALNWVRSHASQLDIQTAHRDLLENTDIHIHFPAGAVMKDGPSAGVTIVTVLVSLFTGRCVRSDTAMTGEVTLRGLVLPIGGLKAKVLAAHRAGISRVILPRRNEKDLHEVPANIKKELSFILASRLEDVLNAAFDDGFPNLKAASSLLPSKI